MSLNYTALADKAKVLIATYGRSVTFLRLDRTVADADKPWRGATDPIGDAVELATKAVFVPPASATKLGLTTETGDLLKRSSSILIVALGATAPEDLSTYDVGEDGSRRWKIEGVETLKPADTTLLYFVGVSQ